VNVHIPLGKKTLVMGIINVTPDSFYSGSRSSHIEEAVKRALWFEDLGADIVDIGGESTRPGSEAVSVDEEIARVIPVLEGIRRKSNIAISIDTNKHEVLRRALECGLQYANDVTGLGAAHAHAGQGGQPGKETPGARDKAWLQYGNLVARSGTFIILMHMRGTPSDMQSRTTYDNPVQEISLELDLSIRRAAQCGIARDKIILDPGIGFAKTAEQNLSVLKNLHVFKDKGYPLLVGLSRKSFLGVYTGRETHGRLASTIALNATSIYQGADIIRVHDVAEAVDTARIVDALTRP
jgi:dihydropteroate synthase